LPIPASVGFEPRPVVIIESAPLRDPLATLMALSEDERLALFT